MNSIIFWDVMLCSLVTFTAVSDECTASILKETSSLTSFSETSVIFYQTTWRNIPEDTYDAYFPVNASTYMARLATTMNKYQM
jgi:hypothetical protein